MPKIVHVVGTGTIGEPLIGLLADHRNALGIDEVTFHKRTPLAYERSKVNDLLYRGAKLCVDDNPEIREKFLNFGHKVSYGKDEALQRATVVIDCTPNGNANKRDVYSKLDGPAGFIAQGSEKGFGAPYALNINDSALPGNRFVQVVSCNTHNIAAILASLGFDGEASGDLRQAPRDIVKGTFVCMRRANDVSQDAPFIASPEVGKHTDEEFGTHHARDAYDLMATLGHDLRLWSSAIKLNTQYMHSMWFSVQRGAPLTLDEAVSRFEAQPGVAMTYRRSANRVFSFGRDHGYYGRILNQAVVARDTVAVDGETINGFCFTPQDGNSLLSSVAATLWFLNKDDWRAKLQSFDRYLFQEV